MIAIITLLVALLMPGLAAARGSAQMALCGTNLRQIHMAFIYFLNDNKDWSPPAGNKGLNYNAASTPQMNTPWWTFHDFLYTKIDGAFGVAASHAGFNGLSSLQFGVSNIKTTGAFAQFNAFGVSGRPEFHNGSIFHCPSAVDKAWTSGNRMQDYNVVAWRLDNGGGNPNRVIEWGGPSNYDPWSPSMIRRGNLSGTVNSAANGGLIPAYRKHEVGTPGRKILMLDVGGSGDLNDTNARVSTGIDEYNIGGNQPWGATNIATTPSGIAITKRHLNLSSNAVHLDGHVESYSEMDSTGSPFYNFFQNQYDRLSWDIR